MAEPPAPTDKIHGLMYGQCPFWPYVADIWPIFWTKPPLADIVADIWPINTQLPSF